TLSRMETPSNDVFDHEVDMPALLEQLESEAKRLNEAKQHKIEFDVAPVRIYGKENLLRSAMQNLITNAINYTPDGGEIKVTWKTVAGGVEFSVKDNGKGIAAEHLPRLTERFYRVEDDRNSASGGTGLGLSIVKHAIEHHNSQLDINSSLEKGSRFSFRIPSGLLVS
ncbi:MAG: two-component system sensor histidine kinase PhoR, partial [Halomonas sp.]|nr:two-component system sensor histidine kinase PhoR [Halomonas sp.]